jgi:hypothetical protein
VTSEPPVIRFQGFGGPRSQRVPSLESQCGCGGIGIRASFRFLERLRSTNQTTGPPCLTAQAVPRFHSSQGTDS